MLDCDTVDGTVRSRLWYHPLGSRDTGFRHGSGLDGYPDRPVTRLFGPTTMLLDPPLVTRKVFEDPYLNKRPINTIIVTLRKDNVQHIVQLIGSRGSEVLSPDQ